MTSLSQIITDLEGFGASQKVIGYVTALQTVGYIITPPPVYVPTSDPTNDAKPKGRSRSARGPSKAAQTILAALTPEGMPMRAIVTTTGLKAKQAASALSTMQKNGTAYLKNSRWFAGTAPAKAASKQPGTRQRKAPVAKPTTGISLSEATLDAVKAGHQEGAAASSILAYLSRTFGMTVRANHLGIALKRHLRAGRVEMRNDRWYMPNVTELRQAG